MEEKELVAFIEWLPTKVKEFEGKSPTEIVSTLNEMSKTKEGEIQITQLIKEFKIKSSSRLFKKGGKLDYLLTCFKSGGKASDCGCSKIKRKISKAANGEKVIEPISKVDSYTPFWQPKYPGARGRQLQSYYTITGDIIQKVFNPGGQTTLRRIKVSDSVPKDTTYSLPSGFEFNRSNTAHPGYDVNTGIRFPRISDEEAKKLANKYDYIFKEFFK